MIIDGEKIMVDSISYVFGKDKTEIGLEINSNIRNITYKIFNELNYKIIKLDLVFYSLTKKDIPRKKTRFLSENEINILKRL